MIIIEIRKMRGVVVNKLSKEEICNFNFAYQVAKLIIIYLFVCNLLSIKSHFNSVL